MSLEQKARNSRFFSILKKVLVRLKLFGIATFLAHSILGWETSDRRKKRANTKQLISVSPHNIKLYEYFIRYHLSRNVKFITSDQLYSGETLDPTQKYILIRHDVDYSPELLSLLTDVEERLGIHSDIHVIMRDEYYDIRPYVGQLKALKQKKFCVALHTTAVNFADIFSEVRKEISSFKEILGFAPTSFSIHGICPTPSNWAEKRAFFIKKVGSRMKSFGFIGSHNITGVDFWIEDSGLGGEFSYLDSDWIEKEPQAGQIMGVLAHPDHWTFWERRWEFDSSKELEFPSLKNFISIARQHENAQSSH